MPIAVIAITALGLTSGLFGVVQFLSIPLFGRPRERSFLTRSFVGVTLLVPAALGLTWACWAERQSKLPEWSPPYRPSHRLVQPSPYVTDAGRPVPVFAALRPATAEELASVEHQNRVPNLITMAPPGPHYNCHGWVFTGGQYWIGCGDVPQILEDNGYYVVTEPRPGDLIVYRTGDCIEHTGVVRAADLLGVLVESKWGPRGRYIHKPEYQDYAADYAYYRSTRAGHLLQNRDNVSTVDRCPPSR